MYATARTEPRLLAPLTAFARVADDKASVRSMLAFSDHERVSVCSHERVRSAFSDHGRYL